MIARSLLLVSCALAAVPAAAQLANAPSTAKPSVQGYLCAFAGKCDGVENEQVSRGAPRTKGFRLARPTSDVARPDAAPSNRAVRPYQRKARTPDAYGATTRKYVPSTVSAASVTPGSTRPVERPRADLMIGFTLNSAQLSAEGVNAAQIFAQSLLTPELRSKRFLIEGHTDLRGGRALNVALSKARAAAVADYLVVLGVQRDRLQTRGMGPDAPLAGRRASDPSNRRVEAELIS